MTWYCHDIVISCQLSLTLHYFVPQLSISLMFIRSILCTILSDSMAIANCVAYELQYQAAQVMNTVYDSPLMTVQVDLVVLHYDDPQFAYQK
jgi:hypothetical protein